MLIIYYKDIFRWKNLFLLVDLNLRVICDELGSVQHLYSPIGIQLGISHSKLMQFGKRDDPLSAVVDDWLRGNAETSLPISWRSVADALESKHVGQRGLANTIREKYCQEEDQQEQVSDYIKLL